MPNRLENAISPYLRSHAGNPVDWFPWGAEAFAEAERRDVPLLISIGYSTCHWCHVMARESFGDPALAEFLNERFVAIKVDREENPEVDASYLAAASAFTENLGWPLNVFVTPRGRAFYAGTYFPPVAVGETPSFTQILGAVSEAWNERRAEVEGSAEQIALAITASAAEELETDPDTATDRLPDLSALDAAVSLMERFEDTDFGGFGGAPKFPVAPVLGFLLARKTGRAVAARTLRRMAASPLRDAVEGGFFRYATRRDWSEPHYERMLYDNALLLDDYTMAWQADESRPVWAAEAASGIAGFLTSVLRLDSGGFASAQDSESTIAGERVEGRYYELSATGRSALEAPPLDKKVLTGWNGLAIAALARAGFAFGRGDWVDLATACARYLLSHHVRADGSLVRVSLGNRISDAPATLEDYGGFAGGLLACSAATGDLDFAVEARRLIDAVTESAGDSAGFWVPGGGDRLLGSQGLGFTNDPSEGAYPSGLTLCASAAHVLYMLGAGSAYERSARTSLSALARRAEENPMAYGGAIAVMSALQSEALQLVIVRPDASSSDHSGAGAGAGAANAAQGAGLASAELIEAARRNVGGITVVVSETQAASFARAGFELFEGREMSPATATAYLCHEFVCSLPVTTASALTQLIKGAAA